MFANADKITTIVSCHSAGNRPIIGIGIPVVSNKLSLINTKRTLIIMPGRPVIINPIVPKLNPVHCEYMREISSRLSKLGHVRRVIPKNRNGRTSPNNMEIIGIKETFALRFIVDILIP
jgi:hypothetical protein